MLASEVRVAGLKSASECWKAIELIESDSRNVLGGTTAWLSGRAVYFTDSAKKKIEALERRANMLSPDEDE